MPPPGSYLLAEYTTFNHDGFVEFARRMRAASPDFPIKIGATMLPQPGELPTSRWVPADSLKAVFEQMDFLILHHYLPTNDSRTFSYTFRRQTAADRVAEQDSLFNVFRNASTAALGYQKEIGLGVTEWNLFNTNDSLVSRNRSLESAVMGAEWFIRTLNGWTTTPVWIADQFNLAGKNSKFALIETDAPTYRIAPLGMVFAGFRSWRGAHLLSTTVSTPAAPAYSQDVPLIRAAAALSANGDTLLFAMVNNAESDTVSTRLNISNFPYHSVEWRTLNGPDPAANRDGGNSLARESTGFRAATLDSLLLPPHSVTFVKFWQAGVTAIRSQEGNIPDQPILFQNYPNPFNPSTTIRFILTPRVCAPSGF